MSEPGLFSAHWHRVRDVAPRLADEVDISRHVYRGRVAWVLRCRASNAWQRLDQASFGLVDHLDGRRTVGEIWERAMIERDRDAPTQDQWMALLADLHAADLLVIDRRVPAEALFERREAVRKRERRQRWLNPLYMRVRLHDPDPWLSRLEPLARALFSRGAALAWLALVLAGAVALLANGERLAAVLSDPNLLSPRTALLTVLLYPPLKFLHELGHALAVKRRGGAVPEFGVALMVMVPLPYVDASASAAFPERGDRMIVSAAGILVELGAAGVGALLWASGAGWLADIGLTLVLIGGLSTLLVNGNPLLKFDGYYLLADALEIPNLAGRARRETLARLRALLVGEPALSEPGCDARERAWLLVYGLVAGPYRTGLTLWIAWWISDRWLALGLMLGLWAAAHALLVPLAGAVRAFANDAGLGATRPRLLAALLPSFAVALLLWVPLPHASVVSGVVWLPDEAVVRAAGDCEITRVSRAPGSDVLAGEELFQCTDPELTLRERELVARLDELDAQLAGTSTNDPAEHARHWPERHATAEALADARLRLGAERRMAALDGRFDVAGTHALEGRALARGEIAGYVVPQSARTVRVAIDENAIARVDASDARVEIRLDDTDGASRTHPTRVLERTPRATYEVPSAALGSAGGGDHASDPAGDGRRLLEPVFDVELAWPVDAGPRPVGARVDVRFVHAPMPLADRLQASLGRALAERGRR